MNVKELIDQLISIEDKTKNVVIGSTFGDFYYFTSKRVSEREGCVVINAEYSQKVNK